MAKVGKSEKPTFWEVQANSGSGAEFFDQGDRTDRDTVAPGHLRHHQGELHLLVLEHHNWGQGSTEGSAPRCWADGRETAGVKQNILLPI